MFKHYTRKEIIPSIKRENEEELSVEELEAIVTKLDDTIEDLRRKQMSQRQRVNVNSCAQSAKKQRYIVSSLPIL